MPIRESSFRIGSGRYVQEANLLSKAAEEISRFGKFPIFIGDDTSIALTREALTKSLSDAGMKYEFVIHNGSCNDERAGEIAKDRAKIGYDVVVGVGGGVIMDFAKVCASFAECPIINIPTSSATCASFTPLSVRYTPEGRTVGTMHFPREVDAVLVDSAVLLEQPIRLLLAGVFDAMAKFIEIKQRFSFDLKIGEFPIGLNYAYALAKHTYEVLTQNVSAAIEAMKCGEITPAFEEVVFTSIAVTGVVSGIARGSNQCALAHKFYETTRLFYPEKSKPHLHGEIVGVGLILQNHFNGEEENNEKLIELMRAHDMPASVSELGISLDDDTFEAYADKIINSSAINKENEEECIRFRNSLKSFWR